MEAPAQIAAELTKTAIENKMIDIIPSDMSNEEYIKTKAKFVSAFYTEVYETLSKVLKT